MQVHAAVGAATVIQCGLRARLSTSIECQDEHWDVAKNEKLSHGQSVSNRIVEATSTTGVVVVTTVKQARLGTCRSAMHARSYGYLTEHI